MIWYKSQRLGLGLGRAQTATSKAAHGVTPASPRRGPGVDLTGQAGQRGRARGTCRQGTTAAGGQRAKNSHFFPASGSGRRAKRFGANRHPLYS